MSQRKDDLEKILQRHNACAEAFPWAARHSTLEELWEHCDQSDWMLWALDAFGYANERKLRLFAASCALRVQRLWDDPQGARAVETATDVATGAAGPAELAAAYQAASKATAALPDRADYSEAMAAAAAAAAAAVRDVAMDAAMDAARESARAVWWDVEAAGSWPEEAVWQSSELRRIVGADIEPLIADIRKRARGVLTIAS